jgi:hypothetical protein
MPVPRQVIQRTMEIGPRMSGLPKAPVTCSAKLRGSLDRHLPPARTTEDDMHAMRRAAWRKQGIVVLRPDDISDDWTRLAVIAEATRIYGERERER